MMNTWNFIDNIFTNKVDRAIAVLEALSGDSGSQVMDFLLKHDNASELDLLVQTRLEATALENLLGMLHEYGVLLSEHSNGGVAYRVNRAKIGRIHQLVAHLN